MVDYKLLYRNIVGLMEEMDPKMTLGMLESSLDLSPGYLSRCVKGTKRLSIDAVAKVAEFFEVSIDDLISKELVPAKIFIEAKIIGKDDEGYIVETENGYRFHVFSKD